MQCRQVMANVPVVTYMLLPGVIGPVVSHEGLTESLRQRYRAVTTGNPAYRYCGTPLNGSGVAVESTLNRPVNPRVPLVVGAVPALVGGLVTGVVALSSGGERVTQWAASGHPVSTMEVGPAWALSGGIGLGLAVAAVALAPSDVSPRRRLAAVSALFLALTMVGSSVLIEPQCGRCGPRRGMVRAGRNSDGERHTVLDWAGEFPIRAPDGGGFCRRGFCASAHLA